MEVLANANNRLFIFSLNILHRYHLKSTIYWLIHIRPPIYGPSMREIILVLDYIRATASQTEVLHASTIDILPVSITTDFLFLQICGVRYVSCQNGVMGLGKVSFGMSYYMQPSLRFTFSGCMVTLPLHPHLLTCVNLFVVAACLLISPWTVTHRLTLSCGSYSRDGEPRFN